MIMVIFAYYTVQRAQRMGENERQKILFWLINCAVGVVTLNLLMRGLVILAGLIILIWFLYVGYKYFIN